MPPVGTRQGSGGVDGRPAATRHPPPAPKDSFRRRLLFAADLACFFTAVAAMTLVEGTTRSALGNRDAATLAAPGQGRGPLRQRPSEDLAPHDGRGARRSSTGSRCRSPGRCSSFARSPTRRSRWKPRRRSMSSRSDPPLRSGRPRAGSGGRACHPSARWSSAAVSWRRRWRASSRSSPGITWRSRSRGLARAPATAMRQRRRRATRRWASGRSRS